MAPAQRSGPRRPTRSGEALSCVHPDAAAIDIGATQHVAAVGPDRDAEPVRTFATFTGDLPPAICTGWRTGSTTARSPRW